MVIGIAGRRGSGKDAVCTILKEMDGYKVERRAFADPLKVSAARALGFSGPTEDCLTFCNNLKESGIITVTDESHDYHLTGREYLQWYGTEAHRDVFGTDFWVDMTLPEDYNPEEKIVVITDVRFENEATRVLNNGGVMWEIHRPSLGEADAHVSEKPLPSHLIDRVIVNDGSLKDLFWSVLHALNNYDEDRMGEEIVI